MQITNKKNSRNAIWIKNIKNARMSMVEKQNRIQNQNTCMQLSLKRIKMKKSKIILQLKNDQRT